MPVRKKTAMKRQQNPLTQGETCWLYDREQPEPWAARFFMSKSDFHSLWDRNRDDVLKCWIESNPCTRPGPWWDYDSPIQEIKDRLCGAVLYADWWKRIIDNQAAYLQQHGLLTPAELKHLAKHPELLEAKI